MIACSGTGFKLVDLGVICDQCRIDLLISPGNKESGGEDPNIFSPGPDLILIQSKEKNFII